MLLLRGATLQERAQSIIMRVSIHAPLARSNNIAIRVIALMRRFNTCSSCEEQPGLRSTAERSTKKFQYMLLLRGATCYIKTTNKSKRFQYMLLLRGATGHYLVAHHPKMFQYMLLLRGATRALTASARILRSFNTCSSCEEQQSSIINNCYQKMFQYMLLLRGATQIGNMEVSTFQFQYMLLLRGATQCGERLKQEAEVSIHAPLARSNW